MTSTTTAERKVITAQFANAEQGEERVNIDLLLPLRNGKLAEYPTKFACWDKSPAYLKAKALIGAKEGIEIKVVYDEKPAKSGKGSYRDITWIGRVTEEPPADLMAVQAGLKPAPAQNIGPVFPSEAGPLTKERPAQVPGDSHGYAGREQYSQQPMNREDAIHMGAVAHDAAVVLAAWIAKTGRCPDQAEEEAILKAFQSIRDAMFRM